MKLLQLNVTANWGSTGKIAEGIGVAAMARGWESTIAYARQMNLSRSQLIKVGNRFDVYAHYAQHRLFDREGLGSKRPTKRLIKWIDSYEPNIIHLHNIHDHWLNYPLLFQYLATINTPIVWTFHDCWAFTGSCPHFENQGCFKWKEEGCNDCALGFKNAKTNFNLKNSHFGKIASRLHIVCVSEWLARYVRQSMFKNTGASVQVIYNGIDVHGAFKPSIVPKKKMILGVSNVWPETKGLKDFVKLRDSLPTDLEIYVVGLSNAQIASLPKGVKGIARTANVSELAKLYSEASVFVNPTYNDSFPTVNLEALACGTPVVTYRTGGSPEAVDAKTGLVVEKGDLHGLADAIMKVLSEKQAFKPNTCRQRAATHFDRDAQFNKYIDLYESLL